MSSFANSCAIIQYPCQVGSTFINPCDCLKYLLCSTAYSVISNSCPRGTAWDHQARQCLETNQVVIRDNRCVLDTPWERCKDVNGRQEPSTLRKMCLKSSGNGGGGGGNTGAVVGGILSGLVAVMIVAIIVCVMVKKKKKPLPEWFRSKWKSYKSNNKREQQNNEPVEEIYDVIDEKQVSRKTSQPIDNPGYDKQTKPHGILYHNTTGSNSHSPTQNGPGTSNSDDLPYSTLKPEAYHDINRSYSTLRASQEEDLSRSISINGAEVAVQDNQGYFIGYPSGTVPRQPSPIPTNIGNDEDDGYSLGKAPEPDVEPQSVSRLPPDYFVLQPSDKGHMDNSE